MASIIPGFDYDIFISYRHNDNRFDGWVSEFVEKLKLELQATIKERLSIYFDQNPEDGLKDTHIVHRSLDTRLKAAVFIPILSQTYCDQNSYAWKSEFLSYLQMLKDTNQRLEIPVPNGNYSSRVLPVRIHNIDKDDQKLIEHHLGGFLRSVDFVYESHGVNRPLRMRDDDSSAPGKLLFRNQINKVALAIKDVIYGLKLLEPQVSPPPPSAPRIISAPMVEAIQRGVITAPRIETGPEPDGHSSDRKTIFLAFTSNDLKVKREELAIILQKAGFNVIPGQDCPADDNDFKALVAKSLEHADCTLHMLSTEFGRRLEEDDDVSFPMYQHKLANELTKNKGIYQVTWLCADPEKPFKAQQSEFINNIQNSLGQNMIFSNAGSPVRLIDDLRNLLIQPEVKETTAHETEIFFVYNQQDEEMAESITDNLSNEYPLESLMIEPDSEEEFKDFATQQIKKSRLAVVYFKYAADWAIPFLKQVWKEAGGASSHTRMMLIGDNDPRSNLMRTFKAPKVTSKIVATTDIVREISVFYTQVETGNA